MTYLDSIVIAEPSYHDVIDMELEETDRQLFAEGEFDASIGESIRRPDCWKYLEGYMTAIYLKATRSESLEDEF
jgi:hypothetical protein